MNLVQERERVDLIARVCPLPPHVTEVNPTERDSTTSIVYRGPAAHCVKEVSAGLCTRYQDWFCKLGAVHCPMVSCSQPTGMLQVSCRGRKTHTTYWLCVCIVWTSLSLLPCQYRLHYKFENTTPTNSVQGSCKKHSARTWQRKVCTYTSKRARWDEKGKDEKGRDVGMHLRCASGCVGLWISLTRAWGIQNPCWVAGGKRQHREAAMWQLVVNRDTDCYVFTDSPFIERLTTPHQVIIYWCMPVIQAYRNEFLWVKKASRYEGC